VVTFDPDRLRTRLAELEQELGQPGFWDEQQHAAAVSAEHARIAKRLERYDRLMQEYADAKELADLDESYADDVAASLAPLHRELGRLQEDALFSGEYDSGDAVVSIQADAGGTDAQDWAEILLRMYLRWAANRGFKTEVLETSPGEEYGIKSATFTVKGENA
jgi:peptide chain release factor 2